MNVIARDIKRNPESSKYLDAGKYITGSEDDDRLASEEESSGDDLDTFTFTIGEAAAEDDNLDVPRAGPTTMHNLVAHPNPMPYEAAMAAAAGMLYHHTNSL